MSTITKTVTVVTSVDNLLALLTTAVKDVKAGKTAAQVGIDLLPLLVTAFAGIGDLAKDVMDKKALEVTIALKLSELVDVLAS